MNSSRLAERLRPEAVALRRAGKSRREIKQAPDQLIYRVHIHENADADAAQRFWLTVTGADPSQFRHPTIKRHNPKTIRRNVGDDYRGCLRIDVRRSVGLYRRIEGWARAAMSTPAEPACTG